MIILITTLSLHAHLNKERERYHIRHVWVAYRWQIGNQVEIAISLASITVKYVNGKISFAFSNYLIAQKRNGVGDAPKLVVFITFFYNNDPFVFISKSVTLAGLFYTTDVSEREKSFEKSWFANEYF